MIGSYLPRRCGIATFTNDLRGALAEHLGDANTCVLAMDDTPAGYPYPQEVRFQVREQLQADYQLGADFLNINQINLTVVQHEYGIYGGDDGRLLLELVRRLRMPVISTLHTVLERPTEGQAAVVRELSELSDRLVVMSRKAEGLLREGYDVPTEKVAFIPHGIPDVPFVDPNFHKDQYGVEGRTVLLTFGLINSGKGIEVALKALPEVVAKHPDVVYIILGATHPGVLKAEGDAYRNSLHRLVDDLKLKEHVIFQNRFVTLEELCGYIGAADVYLTPYRNREQIVSGTLAYAMGAGKPVISTPYWYAEEMLADGRGLLFPFDDSAALAERINHLLGREVERHAIRKKAYMQGRRMVWKEVAGTYLDLFKQSAKDRARRPRPVHSQPRTEAESATLPEPNLAHLRTLTDDTGLFQHAVYTVPDRNHGYCTDDNARALGVVMAHYDLTRDDDALRMATVNLAFLRHAFDPAQRRFRNFLSFDRKWIDEKLSDDAHGRALWGLGLASALAPEVGMRRLSARLFEEALGVTPQFKSPRSWALTLVGIHAYLRRFSGDALARRVRKELAERLSGAFERNGAEDWPWPENVVTYANAKLPHALILSGQWLPDQRILKQGLDSLAWLIKIQTSPEGHLTVIGNDGWLERGGRRARFDQQPIEAMSLVEACAEAYRATQDKVWSERMLWALQWFLGNNDLRLPLVDFKTGGCRDGLGANGVNYNQGAESTVAWLLALLTAMQVAKEQAGAAAAKAEVGSNGKA